MRKRGAILYLLISLVSSQVVIGQSIESNLYMKCEEALSIHKDRITSQDNRFSLSAEDEREACQNYVNICTEGRNESVFQRFFGYLMSGREEGNKRGCLSCITDVDSLISSPRWCSSDVELVVMFTEIGQSDRVSTGNGFGFDIINANIPTTVKMPSCCLQKQSGPYE